MTLKHELHMRRAIELALQGRGETSPNPCVGAVIVKEGSVVGEGFHLKAGLPHAEINAIKDAGESCALADMYVTLEPCCHFGRTPPCVDAIIASGIKRVIVGTKDPNPKVRGKGIKVLRKAGIEVVEKVLESECKSLNHAYNKFITTGRPYITAKVATSLDGKIATASGHSKWITNEKCRNYVHQIRFSSDAILVGGGTVRKDDPRLTIRLKDRGLKVPYAIIVDEKLNIPKESKVFKRNKKKTLFFTTNKASKSRVEWIRKNGYDVHLVRAKRNGELSLPHLMDKLGSMNITSVLVEGGGEIYSDFLSNKLIDKMVVCIAPKLIGGHGIDFLPNVKIDKVAKNSQMKGVTFQSFDDNMVIEGYLR